MQSSLKKQGGQELERPSSFTATFLNESFHLDISTLWEENVADLADFYHPTIINMFSASQN